MVKVSERILMFESRVAGSACGCRSHSNKDHRFHLAAGSVSTVGLGPTASAAGGASCRSSSCSSVRSREQPRPQEVALAQAARCSPPARLRGSASGERLCRAEWGPLVEAWAQRERPQLGSQGAGATDKPVAPGAHPPTAVLIRGGPRAPHDQSLRACSAKDGCRSAGSRVLADITSASANTGHPLEMQAAKKEPAVLLRQSIVLAPKRGEDNYDMSDPGEDSDDNDSRTHSKPVPKWCETYIQELEKQAQLDPDTIFGSKVPHCNLEEVFSDHTYARIGTARPRRRRGSSGEWARDRLTRTDVRRYKAKLGQTRCWSARAAPPTA